ncbi:MAG: PIN/TRAM domain-containing protein [Phascolarctobacterium sp.]|nr:PIN/TRAM domain-containing protein [Candidatus Phascolarctobacterium equi]
MIKKIFSFIITVVFVITGLIVTDYYMPFITEAMGYDVNNPQGFFGITTGSLITGVLSMFCFTWIGIKVAPTISDYILDFSERWASLLAKIPTSDIFVMLMGLVLGLIVGNLLGGPFSYLPIFGSYIPIIFSLILALVGAKVALRKRDDILDFFTKIPGLRSRKSPTLSRELNEVGSPLTDRMYSNNKLLDTSVIIDGRVMDILAAGFMDGRLVIPNFVLSELQKLADSSDSMKRAKGRRGLDLVSDLQKSYADQVVVVDDEYEDVPDVDAKLLRMAKDYGTMIVTNDFNLNKLAGIQGIRVLNINELANAIKPVVMSGEEMNVFLVKEGKEQNQALAYLDDGTMIVVENGRKFIGTSVTIVVTSVLQTVAGRMIFSRVK